MTPTEFFDYGRDLIDGGESEAHFRTAASRIYYSSYHSVLDCIDDFCDKQDAHDHTGGVHSRLLLQLRTKCKEEKFKTGLRAIQTSLRLARDLRVTADYDLKTAFSKENAKDVYRSAQQINKSIAQLSLILAKSTPPDSPMSPLSEHNPS